MTEEPPDGSGWDAETERQFEREFAAEDETDTNADDGDDVDVDEPDDEPGPPGPRTAYAVNWKTVIAVDAAMGLVVVAAGFVAMVVWSFVLGAALAGLGLFYVAMVVRRGRVWQHLRRQAGL